MKKSKILLIVVVLAMCFGLATSCFTMKFDWAPEKVAVLPFMNQTADVNIPFFARAYLFERLQKRKKYEMIPLEEVDTVLNDMGITEGGQLNSATVTELSEKLGADGIVYGDVLVAKRVKLGIYFEKTFECHYMMYRGSDEAVMWDQTLKDSKKTLILTNLKDAAEMMIETVAEEAILMAFNKHPLKEQIENVTKWSIRYFPVM